MTVATDTEKIEQEVVGYLQFILPPPGGMSVSNWLISGNSYLAFAASDCDFDRDSVFLDLVRGLEALPVAVAAADEVLRQRGCLASESQLSLAVTDRWNAVAALPRFFTGELL